MAKTVKKIQCNCGQSFTAKTLDGNERLHCPICQRPVVVDADEVLLIAELAPERPSMARAERFECYNPLAAAGSVVGGGSATTSKQWENEPALGVWRDGDKVVVHRWQHQFPRRCLMTGVPLEWPTGPLELDYLPNRMAWSFLGRSIGRAIGRALYGETIVLQASVSPAWQLRHRIHRVMGTVLIWAGCLLALPAAVSEKISKLPGASSTSIAASGVLLLLVMGLFIGGFAVLLTSRPLRVASVQGDYVWLRGANWAYVSALPPWPSR